LCPFDFTTEAPTYYGDVKLTDDRQAKIRLWVAKRQVVPSPKGPPLPKFSGQKFSSHVEMNQWKQELLLQIARDRAEDG